MKKQRLSQKEAFAISDNYAVGSPELTYLSQTMTGEATLRQIAKYGIYTAIGCEFIQDQIFHRPLIISPNRILVDSLGIGAVSIVSHVINYPRRISRLEQMKASGVDIDARNKTFIEKAKVTVKNKTAIIACMGSFAFAQAVGVPAETPTPPVSTTPQTFVEAGLLTKPYYVDPNRTTGDQIDCGLVNVKGDSTLAIDNTNTVLPILPDSFELASSNGIGATNNVLVEEAIDYPGNTAELLAFDSFQISISGDNVMISNVDTVRSVFDNPPGNGAAKTYVGKNSPAGSYAFPNQIEQDGSFDFTDYGIRREGNNFYLALACNIAAIDKTIHSNSI